MKKQNGVLIEVKDGDIKLLDSNPEKFWEGVTRIGKYAFSDCSSLTSISIPESVTSIGELAFLRCSSLTSINIPKSVTSIGESAFTGCSSLTSINIPESVTSIGYSAFTGCSSLTSINIPKSVTSIGGSAFSDCSSLTSINIPESVTSIGGRTFWSCSSLTSINIPESVTSIGYSAFTGCSSLTSINIPESVTSIGESAFRNCSSLESIKIPESVTSIGDSAFERCSSLTSINIPESVTSIEKFAFHNCSSLTSINIPKSVTSIGEDAFSGCEKLENINYEYKRDKNIKLFREEELIAFTRSKEEIDYTHKEHKKFEKMLKSVNSKSDGDNFEEFLKLSLMLGLWENDEKLTKVGKTTVKVSDVAQELMQNIFNSGLLKYDELHLNFSNLQFCEYCEPFVNFLKDKTNRADLLNNPEMFQSFYDWFKEREKLAINSNVQEEGSVPTIEENRYKVFNYSEAESGVYKTKWSAPTFKLIKEDISSKAYNGITPETKPLADTLSEHPEYKNQKFFDKAKEIKEEQKELIKSGKIKTSILSKPLKQGLISAVEEYKTKTAYCENQILGNLETAMCDQVESEEEIFTYEMLPKDSDENFIIGCATSCCAKLYGAGAGAQRATMLHPDLQALVIRDRKGEMIAHSIIYVNREKGYAVCNDVEVNIKYRDNDRLRKRIYDKFISAVEKFVEEYNKENDVQITQVNAGLSPNWTAINDFIMKNPQGDILEAVNFDKFKYNGSGSWSGDWQREQYVIYKDEGLSV